MQLNLKSTNAFVAVGSMIRRKAIPMAALSPEPRSKTSLRTGNARSAEPRNPISRNIRNKKLFLNCLKCSLR